jgi:RNA polymerase sigma factor (TIGR02999 family)
MPVVYDELRRRAHWLRRDQHGDDTLTTTGLVHEAYLKLVDQTRANWQDRAHFLAVASMAMRQILVDHARERGALKRGGDLRRVDLDEDVVAASEQAAHLLALDEALTELAQVDGRLARVVECRFFGGLTEEETAEALGITARTVRRDWTKAKALLYQRLRA